MISRLYNKLKPHFFHPIALTVLIVILARFLSILHHCFGTDPGGHKIVAASFHTALLATSHHLPELLLIGAFFLISWKILVPLRPFVTASALLVFGAILLLGQIDFGLLRFLGQRFTPSMMQTYVGPEMVSTQLYRPLLNDFGYVAMNLGTAFAGWLAMGWGTYVYWRKQREPGISKSLILALVVCAGILYLPAYAIGHSRGEIFKPAEWLFVETLLKKQETAPPQNMQAARDDLRALVDIDGVHEWLEPDYPLIKRKPVVMRASTGAHGERPNIIFIVVESLRGRDVGYGLHRREKSNTPRLDKLAKQSVVFPRYIANGSPSTRAFFAINTSVLPHREKFVISSFMDLNVDALPKRLKDFGYVTFALWGSNPSFDNQLDWGRRWYDHLDFELPENQLLITKRISDQLIMDRLLNLIDAHDAKQTGQPFFAYVATTGTHYPYTKEDSYFVPLSAMGDASDVSTGGIEDVQVRYDITLKNLDYHVGRVVDSLEKSGKLDNTLIVVVGDHADNTNENVNPGLRGMPVDYRVWTSALIYGPERLIGPPRVEPFPASHVDLMPTILNIVGDTRPNASMGMDLFADIPHSKRRAVAIRETGFRVDQGEHSLFVRTGDPKSFWVSRSFEKQATFSTSVEGTPFSPEDAAKWNDRIYYLSYLIENNRIWNERTFQQQAQGG